MSWCLVWIWIAHFGTKHILFCFIHSFVYFFSFFLFWNSTWSLFPARWTYLFALGKKQNSRNWQQRCVALATDAPRRYVTLWHVRHFGGLILAGNCHITKTPDFFFAQKSPCGVPSLADLDLASKNPAAACVDTTTTFASHVTTCTAAAADDTKQPKTCSIVTAGKTKKCTTTGFPWQARR